MIAGQDHEIIQTQPDAHARRVKHREGRLHHWQLRNRT